MFSYTKLMQAMVAAGVVTPTDPYFNLVTLLLPGNGTNGAQNNTFLDSSSNNFTITRNGNTTQGTFSPFSQTGWSNYFDGTDDYLAIADNAVLRPGAGAFTLEAWIYRGASGAAHTIYAKGGASTGIVFQVTSTNVLRFTHTTTNIDSTGTISANAWTHVAVVREGTGTNQTKLYINGTQDGQGTVSTDFTQTEEVRIGTNRGATDDFNGYISNLRFVKGTALYTGNFTPSTTPLTTTSQGATATEVELLTCQSNRFVDNSSNAFAITVNGTPSVQAFSPFAPTAAYSAATNGGSGYFDGSGDYLSIADNAALQFSANTVFTIEAWIYPTSVASAQGIMVKRGSSATQEWGLLISSTSTALFGANSNNLIGTTAIKANSWNHIAASSDGTTVSLYLNGARDGTATASSLGVTSSTNAVLIGYQTTTTNPFTGWICDARVVKGTQLYSGTTYTVPTAPLTAVSNTSLLTNFTNAGITDATAKNDLETVGNASISTTQSKFGGSSMYFDGSTSYLTRPYSPLFALGNGNFTVECWINTTQNASGQFPSVVGRWSGGYSWDLRHSAGDNSDKPTFAYNDGSSNFNVVSTGSTIYDGAWHHLAAVRSGNTITLYVDGTSVGTSTFTGTIAAATSIPLTVGNNSGGSLYYTGYIDDLRITIGYARYTANFTPTTTTFPLQ